MYELPTEIDIQIDEFPYTYKEFINRCKELNPEIYEVHHIEPISIGGVDLDFNKVKLSPENHYLAHKLLALEHPYNSKLWYAFWYVSQTHKEYCDEKDYKLIRSMYDYFRHAPDEERHKRRSEASKRGAQNMSQETKENWKRKISEANKGRASQFTDEWKANISKGKKRQYQEHPELREHLSKLMTGRKGCHHTEEFKKFVSERTKGRKWFTNGIKNVREYECPEGYWPGISKVGD